MSPSVRTYIALAVCITSAVAGAFALRTHYTTTNNVAWFVGGPWIVAGQWLAGSYTREGWARINKPIRGIYLDAKGGKLPKPSPLANAMSWGGMIMMLAGWIALFTGHW